MFICNELIFLYWEITNQKLFNMQTYLKIHHEVCDKQVPKELSPCLLIGTGSSLESRKLAGKPGPPGTDRGRKGAAFRAVGGSTTPNDQHRIRRQDM